VERLLASRPINAPIAHQNIKDKVECCLEVLGSEGGGLRLGL